MSRRPICIDLFSGAGGLSLGFEQAGFDVVAAVDVDPIHAAVHKFNFPECTVIPRSVRDLTGKNLRKAAGIGSNRIDVVCGGAPCQGFSLIGHRALDDPRNGLVRDFVRLVDELRPSYFVFENVKGLTVGKHVRFLEELIDAFEDCGYKVLKPWQVLNSTFYGVPQHRERLFLLGTRRGFPMPSYPEPFTVPAGNNGEGSMRLPKGPSSLDALRDLPDADRFAELIETDSVFFSEWAEASSYAKELRCEEDRHWRYGYRRLWDRNMLTSSMRTEHTEISRRRFTETKPGTVEPISRFYKLDKNGISNTLRAGTDSARGAFTSPRPIHYSDPRCITVREMARLHGFPDWFRFHQTKWHGARQIGNAVAPPIGRAVASQIAKALGVRCSRPTRIVALGNPKLLQMDMSQAAEFWNIPVPIGRRDKKSGAKKRSQEEIEAERLSLLRRQPNGKFFGRPEPQSVQSTY